MKTIKKVLIKKVVPWTHYNEHEGHIEAIIEGHEVSLYTIMGSVENWSQLQVGNTIEREVWLERTGNISVESPDSLPALVQKNGVNYILTGEVMEIDGELLTVRSVIDISVDIEMGPAKINAILNQLKKGDIISVEGALQVDLI